jgi:hypothetical protein
MQYLNKFINFVFVFCATLSLSCLNFMKKNHRTFFFFILISFSFLFFACGNSIDKEKFINTYREILITRAKFDDSLQANKAVLQVLQQNGYDLQTFQQDFIHLAKNENGFLILIDSMRNSITREHQLLLDSSKKNSNNLTPKE